MSQGSATQILQGDAAADFRQCDMLNSRFISIFLLNAAMKLAEVVK